MNKLLPTLKDKQVDIIASIVNKLPPTLKDKQVDVIASIMNKADTFAMLPTAYSQSYIYALLQLLWNMVIKNFYLLCVNQRHAGLLFHLT